MPRWEIDAPTAVRARSIMSIETVLGERTRGPDRGRGSVTDARLADAWAHIDLPWAVPLPLFLRAVTIRVLNAICIRCGAPRQRLCATCGCDTQPTWILYDGMFLRAIVARGQQLPRITPSYVVGLLSRVQPDADIATPDRLFTDVVAVPPLRIRPPEEGKGVSKWTESLRAITRQALAIREQRHAEPSLLAFLSSDETIEHDPSDADALRAWDRLCRTVALLHDHRLRPRSERQYTKRVDDVAARFVLPKAKEGRLRGSILSKRQARVARLVIAPCLDVAGFHVHDVGLPAGVAATLGVREGEWVQVQRAPTLHRNSMLGHRVRIHPPGTGDHVMRLHPAVLAGYNADYDGDEMQVYVPTSARAQRETRELMCVDYHMLDDTGAAIVGFMQNWVMAAEALRLADELDWLPPRMVPPFGPWDKDTLNGPGGLVSRVASHLASEHKGALADWLTDAYARLDRWVRAAGLSLTLAELKRKASDALDVHRGAAVASEGAESGLELAIRTRAKGGPKELRQIVVEIGQQQDWQGAPLAGGHIQQGFLQGMKPLQQFLHLSAARAALVDTAVHTSETGLLQRQITMALEGLVLHPDGVIRDHSVRARQLISSLPLPTGTPRMVGHLAAMAIMAPLTQANLRSFHHAGTAGLVKLGIPGLRALLHPSRADLRVYAAVEIDLARRLLVARIQACIQHMGIPPPATEHINLLVARMTWDGRVCSIGSSQLGADFGPTKRASDVRPLDVFARAAAAGAHDPCEGPLESRVWGRRFSGIDVLPPAEPTAPAPGLWGDLTAIPSSVQLYDPETNWEAPEAYRPESPSYRPTSPSPVES